MLLHNVLAGMTRCSMCNYVSPPDGPKHTARSCPLRQTECRRSLPEGHPFFEAGHCVSAGCVHKSKCNTCGVPGHLYGTQTLNTRRWKINVHGRVVRKPSKKALCKADFVCSLMTDVSIKSMVDNSHSVAAAAAVDAHQRRVMTSRIRGNTNVESLDINETVRVLEDMNSDAAVLNPKNKASFEAACDNAHLGAVAAGHAAAAAAESSMDESTPDSLGDDDKEYDNSSSDGGAAVAAKGARRGGGSGSGGVPKALHAHVGGRQSRTDRYASAVALGQRRSTGTAKGKGAASMRSGRKGKGKNKVKNEAVIVVDDPVAAASSSNGDWPATTRQRFEVPLPVFFSPHFGGMPPLRIAHAVSVELCQCPLEDVDAEVAGLIVKGAIEKQVRGYMLTSGTMTPALVSEWLCSAMPDSLRSATLPSMARAVQLVVTKAAAAAAAASGVGGPLVAAAVAALGASDPGPSGQ